MSSTAVSSRNATATPDLASDSPPDREPAATEDAIPSLEQLAARATRSYRSLGDTVYEVLQKAITSGALEPGSKISQTALAESLGVSRIPVRAALVQLESEGLVEFQPRRGVRVRKLSSAQLRESFELRSILESHALRTSMAAMTEQRLTRLRELADELDETSDGPEFLKRRQAYYHELYDTERYPMRGKLIDDLRNVIGVSVLHQRISADTPRPHRALQDAVESHDVDRAVNVLQQHLTEVLASAEKTLSAPPRGSAHDGDPQPAAH